MTLFPPIPNDREGAVGEELEDLTRGPPRRAWAFLEALDLEAECKHRTRTIRECPRWFRGQLCKAFSIALTEWERSKRGAALKLFVLTPRMLLQETQERGDVGKKIFRERMRQFFKWRLGRTFGS